MSVTSLERWYAAQCNGEWEHAFGIKIDTLDNPGWSVEIDLKDTRRQDSTIERMKIERSQNDWIQCWIEKRKFQIACAPLNLSESIEIFLRRFDSA